MKNISQPASQKTGKHAIEWEYGENIGRNNQKETKTTIFNTRMAIKKETALNSVLHLFYVHFVYQSVCLLGAQVCKAFLCIN